MYVCLQIRKISVRHLKVTDAMFSKFNINMYDFKRKVDQVEEEQIEGQMVEVIPNLP